ncbi:MAG: hypothetical protein Q4C88_03785 [Akkermansia sp.]|nr:hypothetical protein [Akkermansia sp.]
MESYSWQDRDEAGNKVVYEARYFGGWWQLVCAPKVGRSQRDEVEFSPVEFTPELWQALRDHLWAKYQRRRVSWDLVSHIDDILAGKATNERRDQRGGKGK